MPREEPFNNIFDKNNVGGQVAGTAYDVAHGVASFFGLGEPFDNLVKRIAGFFGQKGKMTFPTSSDVIKYINSKIDHLLKAHNKEAQDIINQISALPMPKGGNTKYLMQDVKRSLLDKQKALNEKERQINAAVELAKTSANNVDFVNASKKAGLANQAIQDLNDSISKVETPVSGQ